MWPTELFCLSCRFKVPWAWTINVFILFYFICNKSNINHDEKKKQRKKIHGVHDGEHKKKQQTTSKKKLTQGTIQRVERNSMIEEQIKEPQYLDQLKRVR